MRYKVIIGRSFSEYDQKRMGKEAMVCCFLMAFTFCTVFKPYIPPLSHVPIPAEYLQSAEYELNLNSTTTTKSTHFHSASMHAPCRNSNYCEIEGDIRIEPNSSTIVVLTQNETKSWIIEPYPRTGTSRVKKWTVNFVQHEGNEGRIPTCSRHESHPAILFSLGGYTGNLFHDFADVLFPLYLSSSHFKQKVQFLATDLKPWWIMKYINIINSLTKYKILDIDDEEEEIRCYNKVQIGLKFHRELINPPSSLSKPSMQAFRQLLREAYSLERENTNTMGPKKGDGRKPRLMIISRKRTRIINNEEKVLRMAKKMGFEVVVAEAGVSTNISRFAEAVNSCDVLMGMHGAGLTNMAFLPDNAVLIQVIPFGGVDGFARLAFGNPAAGMNLRYVEYKILVRESSLRQQYSMDHPILRNPELYKEWEQVYPIYLKQQNVTIDLRRFKGTLTKTLELIRKNG